ncbi:MAG: L,D-transpeptidase family protein [Myxococcota bacterium]
MLERIASRNRKPPAAGPMPRRARMHACVRTAGFAVGLLSIAIPALPGNPGRAHAAPPETASAATAPAGFASLVGSPSVDRVAADDTLLDIAERHRLGFERVARLNPTLDPWIPQVGARVRLPTYHILPDARHEGLVVNLPELQLYDYGVDREAPAVLALAIGDELDPSLIGRYRVGNKRANPVWNVPASIRAERPELPAQVPPGPDNPLGPFWLTIGQTSYGIHGTNNRWSIGREATHGCLRLYNDVVEALFERTRTGTPIEIVYQTVKLGLQDGIVYVEAHPDRYRRDPDRFERAEAALAQHGLVDDETRAWLRRVIEQASGEPVAIAVLPDEASTAGSAPAQPIISRPSS